MKLGQNAIMNMFKSVKAKSIEEYFEMLPPDRREVMKFLQALILKTAPSLKPNFLYNMPGYGSFPYKNYKKELIDWPVISLASQKNYMSLYVCALDHGQYLAEKHKATLGKVSVGKSCIRFKKLEDLNLETLKKVIQLAEKSPGLVTDKNSL
jgi:uncharacterized protein YdhG (YjbR/CyaY superfamily)